MQLDPHTALQLAFQQMKEFSVPGIGTFKRRRAMAQIDHQKKRIQPPYEEFVLAEGEGALTAFEQFLGKTFGIAPREAQEFAVATGTYLKADLEQSGLARIEGVGTLQRNDAGEMTFRVEEGMAGQAADFFGLQAVDYTLGQSSKPTVEKKKEAAKESVLANTTVVQPTKPRRRFPVGWAIILVLLLIGVGAAWNWQAELKVVLEDMGILDDGKGPTQEEIAAREKAMADSLAQMQHIADSIAAHEAHIRDSLITATSHPKSGKKPPTKSKPRPSGDGMAHGMRPQGGHYYLIVSSYQDGAEAAKMAQSLGAKVLVPPYQNGFYKVSVFESANKGQVIAKMVSLKDRYTKSWIYWPGMPVRSAN